MDIWQVATCGHGLHRSSFYSISGTVHPNNTTMSKQDVTSQSAHRTSFPLSRSH